MKNETKPKEQFKERLIEWAQGRLGVSFSNLNNIQQSRQMIQFFVSEVLERLAPGLTPDDDGELESSIIDGAGDGGADFLFRSDDGQVVIIQAKFRGKDSKETPESVGRFCDFPQRLYMATQGKSQAMHSDLLELAGQIDWEEDNFRLFFITTAANSGDAVVARVDQGITPIPELADFLDRSDFRYLDQSLLNQELREALSSADFSEKPIVIPMLPDSNDVPWCQFEQGDRALYLGEVSGAVLASILQNHKASLFTMNIRDYVGDTRTNKQIIQTALHNPSNFEYFNNGVTAVAGKIHPDIDAGTLTCEKMSIINGAQTVRALLAAVRKKGGSQHKPVSNVRVLLRLMTFDYPKEINFVSEVTKYNNTQNSVKIADFRSNDEVQKDIARRVKNVNLKGRTYEYKNKRSEKGRNNIAITLEDLTKAIYAFRFGPDDMYGGTAKLFDLSPGGLYTQVFPTPEQHLTEASFNLLIGTYFACDFIKQLWETLRKVKRSQNLALHPALERKGLVYFAVGELERLAYAAQEWQLETDLSKLARPNDWLAADDTPQRIALSKAFDIASKVLIQQYEQRKKNEPNFKHRNWFRDQDTLKSIKSGLELATEFGFPPKLSAK
ncbi:MAG TPA: AIPR family protein [Acidobacteriaceae bacterium]|nr:AIPR family protein [Acidobacteriaceae bacterium]